MLVDVRWPTWLTLLLLVAGCGDNDRPAQVLMQVGTAPPAYGTVPFPTDAVRDGQQLGHIRGLDRLTPTQAPLLADQLASIDGWGLRPVIEFFVQGAIDPSTVPPDTSRLTDWIVVVDVDPSSPARGTPVAMDWRYDPELHEILGSPHPGAQLREGTRYAAVLTHDVRSADGEPVTSGGWLDQLLHTTPPRWQTTADAYRELDAMPQLAGRIVAIATFTTQHATDALALARAQLSNTQVVPPPELHLDDPAIIFDTPARLDALLGQAQRDTSGPRAGLEQWGTDNPTGIAHDHVAVVATGWFRTVRFRGNDTGSFEPDAGTFSIGPGGIPRIQAFDQIPITIVLPKAPMPPGGFPVVIFGHGLGGSRHDVLNLAEPLASRGYAIVAIDMSGHGSRYDPTDLINNLSSKPAFTGDPDLRDGFGDITGTTTQLAFFEGFKNIAAIRDEIRQSVLDFARVVQLVQTDPDLSALAGPYGRVVPHLDRTRVAYLGESFGTLVGTDLAAIEPTLGLYVLDVPGGGVIDDILPNSPYIASLALPFVQDIYRSRGTIDRFHPLIAAMQAVFDAGDPLSYAPHVLRDRLRVDNAQLGPRNVIAIEAVTDEIMPGASTAALARALGLGVLELDLDPPSGLPLVPSAASGNVDGQTGVLVQYEPATHGYNWSALHGQLDYMPGVPLPGADPFPKLPQPITITEPIYETQAQVATILQTYFAGGAPVVISTKAPVADFDGDGVPDAQDPAPIDPNVH